MVAGDPRLSGASRLIQRLLWNRLPGAGLRPLPVVVLLQLLCGDCNRTKGTDL
jgi:hypothetical protein